MTLCTNAIGLVFTFAKALNLLMSSQFLKVRSYLPRMIKWRSAAAPPVAATGKTTLFSRSAMTPMYWVFFEPPRRTAISDSVISSGH
jgi:hypothetical protein